MKHLSFAIIFAASLATVFVSCRKGDKGDPGTAGVLPYKSGSITGTLTGTTYQSDENFSENIKFQYFKGPSDNTHALLNNDGVYDTYSITRYDSVGSSYIKLEFDVDYYDSNQDNIDEPHIYNVTATIVVHKKSNNNVFYFGTSNDSYNPFSVAGIYLDDYSSGGNSNFTYDNLTINSTTGAINFDYSLELAYYDNSSQNSAYLDGTVSATPYNVSYRQGAE